MNWVFTNTNDLVEKLYSTLLTYYHRQDNSFLTNPELVKFNYSWWICSKVLIFSKTEPPMKKDLFLIFDLVSSSLSILYLQLHLHIFNKCYNFFQSSSNVIIFELIEKIVSRVFYTTHMIYIYIYFSTNGPWMFEHFRKPLLRHEIKFRLDLISQSWN